MADQTIDSLSLEINSDAKKAASGIERLTNSLLALDKGTRSGLSGLSKMAVQMKNLSGYFGNIQNASKAAKSLEKVGEAASKISKTSLKMDTDQVEAAIENLKTQFKDVGTDFKFTGNADDLDKMIASTSAQLDKLYAKEDRAKAIGTNIESTGFKGLIYDISELTNKMDALRKAQESVSKQEILSPSLNSSTKESLETLEDFRKEYEYYKKVVENGGLDTEDGKNMDLALRAVQMTLEQLEDEFPNANKEIAEFKNLIEQAGGGRPFENIQTGIGNIDSVAEKVEQKFEGVSKALRLSEIGAEEFDTTLKSLTIPMTLETSLTKLQSRLKGVEEQKSKLEYELEKGLRLGTINVDDDKFRSLSIGIHEAESRADMLRQKITQATSEIEKNSIQAAKIFENNLGKLKIPEIRESDPGKLKSYLEKLESDLDKFRTKLENDITMGRIVVDDAGYRKAREQIKLTEKTIDATKKKLKQVGDTGKSKTGIVSLSSSVSVAAGFFDRLHQALKRVADKVLVFGNNAQKAAKKTNSFALTLGKLYAAVWGLRKVFGGLWDSVEKSMDYIETLNYFDAAFGQVAEKADLKQWKQLGYNSAEAYYDSFSNRAKQLTSKMSGFFVTEKGTLEATNAPSLGIDPAQVMNYQAMFGQMSSSMGIASETALKLSNALTMIGGDLASVKNMDFEKVWQDMASGITGMSRAVDKYGINIRDANLQQKLFGLGINTSISKLNQNDKALLRTIVMLESTKYAWGDLASTINQPANQIRLLQANIVNLARTIGNLFLPIVAKILPYINAFVIALQRLFTWIGKILGIDISNISSSVGSGGDAIGDLIGDTDDLDNGLGDAADKAKKLKNNLLGIDELNIISEDTDDALGEIDASGISGLLNDAFYDALAAYQDAWDTAFSGMENKANELADKIVAFAKYAFQPIAKAWAAEGDFVVESWKKAFGSIKNLLSSIGKDMMTVWQQDATVEVLKDIFHIFGDIGKIVSNLADNLEFAWSKNNTGLHILENIRDVFGAIIHNIRNAADYTVEWSAKLNFSPLLEAFESLTRTLAGKMGDISGMFTDFYQTVILGLSKWTLEEGAPKFLGVIQSFVEKVDWAKLRANLQELWEHLEKFGETIGEGLIIFIERISDALANFINSPAFENFLKMIEDWMDSVTPEDVADGLETILKGILAYKAISGVASALKTVDNFLKIFKDSTLLKGIVDIGKKIGGLFGKGGATSAAGEAAGGGGILAKLAGIGTKIGGILKNIGGFAAVVGGAWMAIKNFLSMLDEGFSWAKEGLMLLGIAIAGVGAVILGAPAAVAAVVAAIVAVVGTAVVLIKDNWESIKEFFANLWNNIKDTAIAVWEGLGEFFSGLWQGIKDTAAAAWNGLGNLLSGIWQGIKDIASSIWGGIKEFFGGIWDGIKNVAETVWNGISSFLQNTWNVIRTTAQVVWGAINVFFSSVWNGVKNVAESVWNGISSFLSGVWSGIKSTAESLWGGIKNFFSTVWDGISGVAQVVWSGIKDFLSGIWSGIRDTATNIWNGIKQFFTNLWNGISDTFSSIWNGIKNVLSSIWNGIKDAATGIWNGIKEFFTGIWEGISDTFSNVWNGIKEFLSGIWNGIKETATKVWDSIKNAISKVWDSVKSTTEKIWSGLKTTIGNTWDTIKGWAASKFEAVKTSIKNVWDKVSTSTKETWEGIKTFVGEKIPEIVNNIINFFSELPEKIYDIGKNIISGLINGITEMAGNLRDKVIEIAGNVSDWFKEKLGIHSPSTVFHKLAEYTFQGFINGADGKKESIASKMVDIAKSTIAPFEGMDKTFNTMGTGMMSEMDKAIYAQRSVIAKQMKGIVEVMKQSFSDLPNIFNRIGVNMMNSLLNGINGLSNSIRGIASNIGNVFSNAFNGSIRISMPSFGGYSLPGFASGGVIQNHMLAEIGEYNRREAILPLENRRSMNMIADSIVNSGGSFGNGASDDLLMEQNTLLREQNELLARIASKRMTAVLDTRDTLSGLKEQALREGWSFT